MCPFLFLVTNTRIDEWILAGALLRPMVDGTRLEGLNQIEALLKTT